MKLYTDLYNQYGENVRSLNWGSQQSQHLRFEAMTNNLDLNNQTILDVGCGFGDFYKFLKYAHKNHHRSIHIHL